MTAVSLLTSLPVEFPRIPLLDTLPSQSLEALLAHPVLADAVVATVALVHGREVLTIVTTEEVNGDIETNRLLLIREGDTFHSKWYQHFHQRAWERASKQDARANLAGPGGFEARRGHLNEALARLLVPSRDLATVLQNRWLASPDHAVFANAVTGLWWQARMADGCTPETARMLLGLIVPATLLRLLDFPADGGAPTLLPLRPVPDGQGTLVGSTSC